MKIDDINIRGAKTHNLKNIDVTIPRNKLTVITGLSGSGKSSLAFDTLFAEGQRRYVESLSSYARQFLSMMEKPDVDHISGLSPSISIEQKSTSHNPRSTVGTITEIYDYLRLLFARAGTPQCITHDVDLHAQTISQMVDSVLSIKEGTKLLLLAPIVRNRKGEYVKLLETIRAKGYIRARINGEMVELDEIPKLHLRKKHTIEIVIDRIVVKPSLKQRLAESFELALELTDGIASVAFVDNEKDDLIFSSKYACPLCGYSLTEIEPNLFSFNSPAGACETCDGLGVDEFFDLDLIIVDSALSLTGGAIKGWDKRNLYYFSLLSCLAKHYKFDINKPFASQSKKIQDIVLYGSDDEIKFVYHSTNGRTWTREHEFEGVVNTMQRRYKETDSNVVREELAKYLSTKPCEDCEGTRLKIEALNVYVDDHNIADITHMTIEHTLDFLSNLKLPGTKGEIASKILRELTERLLFLNNVGLNYLSLSRSAHSLSGGEAQRIRLASQIGSGLVGVTYILDEPSIGLHQRDNARLLKTLNKLKNLGNTVVVVEHDEEAIRAADYLIDIGPGAGVHGGEVVASGTAHDIMKSTRSITGAYLSGKRAIPVPTKRRVFNKNKVIELTGVTCNNIKDMDVTIPAGLFTCVTGVSGSGKSSLINDTLYPMAARHINKSKQYCPGEIKSIHGIEQFDKVIDIDQSPIGRTPRSNPATYTGMFTPIRELFSGTHESRTRGYQPGRFSFNVKGGRCEACRGDGQIKVEMHFLPDVYVDCDVCHGKRYNRETLEVTYKGKNIREVLDLTVEEARVYFDAVPVISKKLQTLIDVGLGYIHLGQSAITLSGGEAQRIKLARELSKRDTGKTLYILDEPTTGLHFHDVEQLLQILHRFCEHGNTVIVIEHNLDVIKTADWIVDLGPEGGDKGGELLVQGTPEDVVKCKASHTGQFLKPLLKKQNAKAQKLEKVS